MSFVSRHKVMLLSFLGVVGICAVSYIIWREHRKALAAQSALAAQQQQDALGVNPYNGSYLAAGLSTTGGGGGNSTVGGTTGIGSGGTGDTGVDLPNFLDALRSDLTIGTTGTPTPPRPVDAQHSGQINPILHPISDQPGFSSSRADLGGGIWNDTGTPVIGGGLINPSGGMVLVPAAQKKVG